MKTTAFVALVVLVSGCFGGGGGDPTPTTPAPPTTATGDPTLGIRAELPDWTIGQGWVYTVEIPGQRARSFNMMVAEDHAEDGLWVVASDNRTEAVRHAVYSTNPVLGRIGQETLSPFQGGEPVQMFRFPLTDGKTWQAGFFDETKTFEVTFSGLIDASAIDESHGFGDFVEGFRIEARGPSGATVNYDYVEAVEWFTTFELVNAAGEREFKLTLTDLVEDYGGPYYFYRAKDALDQSLTHADNAAPAILSFDAPMADGFHDRVAVGVVYDGRPGTVPASATVRLNDPSGTEAWSRQYGGPEFTTVLEDIEGQGGTWTVDVEMGGNVALEVRVAGMLIFSEGQL